MSQLECTHEKCIRDKCTDCCYCGVKLTHSKSEQLKENEQLKTPEELAAEYRFEAKNSIDDLEDAYLAGYREAELRTRLVSGNGDFVELKDGKLIFNGTHEISYKMWEGK